LKKALLPGVGVFVVFGAMAWFLGMLPDRQSDVLQAEQLLDAGANLYEEKKYTEALEVLQRVPPGSVEEAKALYYRGSAHMMLEDFESAANQLEQSLALNSEDPGTLYALGVVYFKLGNVRLAKGYFTSVLEINPHDEQAKGLMDIMARLERQSGAESEGEESTDH
jgi:rhomboid protease GluP